MSMTSQLSIFLQHLTLDPDKIHYMMTPAELIEESLKRNMGKLSDTGALCIDTGKFTGRSPRDRFIVRDEMTEDTVDWGIVNKSFKTDHYDVLKKDILDYVRQRELYIHDGYVCADDNYRVNVRVLAEYPWSAFFANNMFLRLSGEEIDGYAPEWTIVNAPGFIADPSKHGTRQGNFAVINFADRAILIGGTGYTGEIKKGVFSVLNYLLPQEEKVLSMHCSANVGRQGDTAIFFGLSGTGKTTLSADPSRFLIGDDEHGWSDKGVFNFEGGCYAKAIRLSASGEPEIYSATRMFGTVLENVVLDPATRAPDFDSDKITENTRASYPIHFIPNHKPDGLGGHPNNVVFLTADAFGVLPPVARLTPDQAMYHFLSGYTAKVAGTERGVTEPSATFSSCFGAPFLPLHPGEYARMLGERIAKHGARVWLVNTGWTGGAYGTGSRMKLAHTRAMVTAVLSGALERAEFVSDPVFGIEVPTAVPGVPGEVLTPRKTWADQGAYDAQAKKLAEMFRKNFATFEKQVPDSVAKAGPVVR